MAETAKLELNADTSALWHLLLDAGKATEEQLQEVYDEHERSGRAFTVTLYNYDIIKESELLQLIADNLGTEVVAIHQDEVPKEIVDKLTPEIVRMYGIAPVKEEDGVLFLAAKDPMDYRMMDELNYVVGQECRILVAAPVDIDDAIDFLYPERADSVKDVLREMEEAGIADIDSGDEDSLEELAASSPIVRFVDVVLYQAVKDQASDIHFEPFADEFRIRYRLDGALYEMAPPPKHLALPVISRLKVLSNLNIAERRHPQDGRIEIRIAGKPIDLRVSTLPTQYGESVVLRVLDRDVVQLDLENLGIQSQDLHDLRLVLRRPNGIVIVTGPTGCGKTTTLYSGLKEINTITEKLLTAEDPVEYDLEGIMQLHVRENVGMTFAGALRSFLRQDPDRIMVGEIRDLETASMAIQASLTGHLVLSTLHTNDAPGAITRLIDMGVEPFLISSTLVGVVAQRLIRRICRNCLTAYEPEDSELELLEVDRDDIPDGKLYYGKGCDACNHTGYKGRVGIFELLRMSPAIQEMVNKRLPTADITAQAVKEGFRSMRVSGITFVKEGISSSEEVLKYT